MNGKESYGSIPSESKAEGRPLLQQGSTLSSGGGGYFGSEAAQKSLSSKKDDQKDSEYLRLSLRGVSLKGNAAESTDLRRRYASVHNDPDVEQYQNPENLWGSTRMLETYLKQQEHHIGGHRRHLSDPGVIYFPENTVQTPSRSNLVSSALSSSTRSLSRIMFEHIDSRHAWHKLTPGSIQQSIVVALVIGVVNGIACFLYYTVLEASLEFFWHKLPELTKATSWTESTQWLWIPIVSIVFCIFTGLSVVFLGEPGDMSFTIACTHGKAFIPMDHVMPMVVASFCSILAAGSLGPEAPLVAICGALGGFVSRRIFGQRIRNVVRKHTLMGMAG